MIAGVLLFGSGWALGRRPVEVHVATNTCLPASEPAALVAPEPSEQLAAAVEAPAVASSDRHTMTPEQAKATIATRAQAVVDAIAHRDGVALARFVDPERGLEMYGMDDNRGVLTVAARDVATCPTDKTRRLMRNVTVTCSDLWREHLLSSFARSPDVQYAAPSPDDSARPEGIIVNYVVARPEHDVGPQRGWSTLRLVFDPMGSEWRLIELGWNDSLSDQPPDD